MFLPALEGTSLLQSRLLASGLPYSPDLPGAEPVVIMGFRTRLQLRGSGGFSPPSVAQLLRCVCGHTLLCS